MERAQGLSPFLQSCGQRINILRLECSTKTFLTFDDLSVIATECPLLDGLEIDQLQMLGKYSLFVWERRTVNERGFTSLLKCM